MHWCDGAVIARCNARHNIVIALWVLELDPILILGTCRREGLRGDLVDIDKFHIEILIRNQRIHTDISGGGEGGEEVHDGGRHLVGHRRRGA